MEIVIIALFGLALTYFLAKPDKESDEQPNESGDGLFNDSNSNEFWNPGDGEDLT